MAVVIAARSVMAAAPDISPGDLSNDVDHMIHVVRLAQKSRPVRQFFWGNKDVAGDDDDADPWPSVADAMREIEAIDFAWHADVGEQNVDIIRLRSDDLKRGGGVGGLDRDAPVFRQNFDGEHSQQHLVVGNQDYQRTIRDF